MSVNQIRLYDLFRRDLHLSDDRAAEVVYAVQEMAESATVSRLDSLATKSDLDLMRKEINGSFDSFRKEINESFDSFRKEINGSFDSFRKEINESFDFFRNEIRLSIDTLRKDNQMSIDISRKENQAANGNLYKAIYISGFLQFIAMIGTVLAVIRFIR